ncbi:MAG: zf-HC2 domain-containing protein [Chloroflexota bacterium]
MSMSCDECIQKLDQFVDRELTDAEVRELKLHLEFCPPCEERYTFQADLKRLVRTCMEQDVAPASLREKLQKILF